MDHDLLWFLLCLFFIFLFFGLLLSILFLRFIFWIIVCICLEERVDAIEERSQYIEMEMDGPIGKQRHHKGNQTLEEEAASVDDSLTLRMNHSSLFILFLLTLLFNILPIFLIILFILTLFFFFVQLPRLPCQHHFPQLLLLLVSVPLVLVDFSFFSGNVRLPEKTRQFQP